MGHVDQNLRDDNAGSGGDDAFESLLARALRIDVPAAGAPAAGRRPRRWLSIAVAASVLIAVGVTVNNFYDARYFSGGDLATDVIAHVHHEPGSLRRTESPVRSGEFDQVLQQGGRAFVGDACRSQLRSAVSVPRSHGGAFCGPGQAWAGHRVVVA